MRAGVSLSLTPGDIVARQIVDLDHALAKLGRAIDWRFLEERPVRSIGTRPDIHGCRRG
jgi:hypothetical protein